MLILGSFWKDAHRCQSGSTERSAHSLQWPPQDQGPSCGNWPMVSVCVAADAAAAAAAAAAEHSLPGRDEEDDCWGVLQNESKKNNNVRRGWDSNPRCPEDNCTECSLAVQRLNHSATSPLLAKASYPEQNHKCEKCELAYPFAHSLVEHSVPVLSQVAYSGAVTANDHLKLVLLLLLLLLLLLHCWRALVAIIDRPFPPPLDTGPDS